MRINGEIVPSQDFLEEQETGELDAVLLPKLKTTVFHRQSLLHHAGDGIRVRMPEDKRKGDAKATTGV